MTLDPRSAEVLGGVVAEYIRTAVPVGSVHLARRLDLQLSAATVRSILHTLEAAGYLMQPHTSAGRVPTDRGYRYWVDHTAAAGSRQVAAAQLRRQWQQVTREYQLARAASKLLARWAHTLALSSVVSRGDVQYTGLQEVLRQPEGERVEAVRELSSVLEHLEQHLNDLSRAAVEPVAYIGEENPFYPAQHTSVMARAVTTAQGETVVLVLVGPKRMPYLHHALLLRSLGDIISLDTDV